MSFSRNDVSLAREKNSSGGMVPCVEQWEQPVDWEERNTVKL